MFGFGQPRGEQDAAPELREHVSAAREHVSELLLVVVGLSGTLGLVTNLLVTWLHAGILSTAEQSTLVGAGAATLALALVAQARLRLSTRELDEEIEVALPVLVPSPGTNGPLELIEVSAYGDVTELGHAAVARLAPEQSAALALATHRIDRGSSRSAPALTLLPAPQPAEEDGEDEETAHTPSLATLVGHDDPVLWFLQLAQLLVIAQCLDESERLLGSEALLHRGHWLRRRTPHLGNVLWDELAASAGPAQPFVAQRNLPGVRQRATVPAAARLLLTDVVAELGAAKRRSTGRRATAAARTEEGLLVPLVRIDAGRAGGLTINGVGRISAHAVPRVAQPAAGLTTRVFLRNARDHDLRRRALEEEALAALRAEGGVPRPGIRPPEVESATAAVGGPEGLLGEHARVWRALYRGARRPRVARVSLTVQGRFRVRLSGRGSVGDQALYAWATALARRVGSLDIDVFMARLAARQQVVPRRRF
jgi:hypothetical protein